MANTLTPNTLTLRATAPTTARQLALNVLLQVQAGAYADVALHRTLTQVTLGESDRALATELVYGTVRRQRTLDALIDQLGARASTRWKKFSTTPSWTSIRSSIS